MRATALVAGWLEGRATVVDGRLRFAPVPRASVAVRARQAYGWLASALAVPHDDLALDDGEPAGVLRLHEGPVFASFLLLPLLNLLLGRRLLFVGAPGRGKTTVATLLGLLAGLDLDTVRRATQRGHPQLTLADLVGAPLPRDLVDAASTDEVRVAWRSWLRLPVKIVDEFNRIPTRTQSALLSLMAEGCVEAWDQVLRVGPSAWFLTANDDLGGGTWPVIEALRDRIDVVVRCPALPGSGVEALAGRGGEPEHLAPAGLCFGAAELAAAVAEIEALPVASEVTDVLAFLHAALTFCRQASDDPGGMDKDTLHLAGLRVADVCDEDCPLDKREHLCARTEGGLSARALQSLLAFSRALAWFRGAPEAGLAELRAVAPWVLLDKLHPNPHAEWLLRPERAGLRRDRARWVTAVLDDAIRQAASYQPLHAEVRALCRAAGRPGLDAAARAALRAEIRTRLIALSERHELCGPVHADLLRLRAAWQRLGTP